MSTDSSDSTSPDAGDSTENQLIDVAELVPPEGEQDPRITRDGEHVEILKERFSRGFLSPLVFTVEEKYIVDGNYRREVLMQLAEQHDDDSYRQLEVLGTKDDFVFAVPTNEIDLDAETASMELNLYRQNHSQVDCARFLKYLVETRIIESDVHDVARDTTAKQLLGQLEHFEDDNRPDEWPHSKEAKQLLYRVMEDLNFNSAGSARTYLTNLQNAPEPVIEAWAREEIGRSHVEELSEISKHTDDEELTEYLKKTVADEYTRDDLRNIKSKLRESDDNSKPPEGSDDEGSDDTPDPTDGLNLTEAQEELVDAILEHRNLSREEYLEELSGVDSIDAKLQQDSEEIEVWLDSGKSVPVEDRRKERQESLDEFDFDSDSKFARGEADHLAPPVEKDHLGVFFHDCRQMGDEIDDESVQLVFTSPPYFTQRGRLGDKWWPEDGEKTQDNADIAYENYLAEMMEVVRLCDSKLTHGGHLMLNVSDYQVKGLSKVYDIPSDLSCRIRHDPDTEFEYVSTITWDKGPTETSSRLATFRQSNNIADFKPAWRTERILVFRKGMSREQEEYCINRDEVKADHEGIDPFTDLWQVPPTTDKDAAHEAGFPIQLPQLAIKLFTYPGETVIDPFGGHATTLRAVKGINRDIDDEPPRKGFAWENFASETSDQADYRGQIQTQLGPLSRYKSR